MLLNLNCSLHSKFQSFSNEAMNEGALSNRERLLATIAASIALENHEELRKGIILAKQHGMTNEEIGQIFAICLSVQKSKWESFGDSNKAIDDHNAQSSCCV